MLRLLKPALFTNSAMSLYRHADAKYLFANWVSVSDAQQVYDGLQAIAEHVREQKVSGLLTCMEEQDALAPGALPSILNRYLPQILASGILCFASVLPPRIYSLATAEIVLNKIPSEMQVQSFSDIMFAHSWLKERLVAVNYG